MGANAAITRNNGEADQANHQKFLTPDAVADVAHGDEQARQDERVDIADPQEFGGESETDSPTGLESPAQESCCRPQRAARPG